MSSIKIFKSNKEIDLPTLIDSRALICANSGGGKSYAVRKLMEETHGKVMSIILDIEGEFKTLREKFDYLLIGDDGDVPLSLKSAHLLPKKILELNVSTIIDISDLKRKERILYVKKFLEALMEVPRKLWKPCIIVLDEAHSLCGQQEKQDSTSSVIDLMTRGRKRGFCGTLCTQRISKLHKDAVAECNNTLIGRTGLDIDMKRASEILGFTNKQDMLSLRDLDAGEFYVFGTAISKKVEKEKVKEVKTTHPKVGMDLREKIVPPTQKIKSMLQGLNDLPKEEEKKITNLNDYKTKVVELQRELNRKPKEVIKEEKVIEIVDKDKLEKAYLRGAKETEMKYEGIIKTLELSSNRVEKSLRKLVSDGAKILESREFSITADKPPIIIPNFESSRKERINKIPRFSQKPIKLKPAEGGIIRDEYNFDEEKKLRAGAIRILNFVAMFESLTKEKAKTLCGISSKGTFGTYIADLARSGFVKVEGNIVRITNEGMGYIGEVEPMPTDTESLINLWSKHLRAGAINMLRICVEIHPSSITKDDLQEQVGILSRGTFGTYLADLRRNGLIKISGQDVTVSEELLEI